jgi:hypothetical protein
MLGDELYVFDAKYQKLVPLINNKVNTLHFYLDTKLYKNQILQFKSQNTTVVFVNNKLFKKFNKGSGSEIDMRINVDDLASFSQSKKQLITLYSPQKLDLIAPSIAICAQRNLEISNKKPFFIIGRLNYINSQTILMAMLLLFFLFFTIQSSVSPYLFRYVYNPLNYFKDPNAEELTNISRIDTAKLLFMFFDCVIIAFMFTIFKIQDWNINILSSLMSSLMYVLLFFVSKFIFNQVIAFVFKLTKYSYIQFFQFMRHSMFFTLVLLLLYIVLSSPFTYFNFSGLLIFNTLLVFTIATYIIKVIFSLKKFINLRSIYFISYICITELIPVILFLVYYFSRINKGFV